MNDKTKKERPELYGMNLEPTYSGSTTFFRRSHQKISKG